ncbi:MAG: MMPL family transporter [Dehalococcoidia bacterium]
MSSSARAAGFLERHSGVVILLAAALTALLVIPLLTMGSGQQASQDPAGEVFDLRDDVNERFAPSVHLSGYIVESPTGDVLTQAALWELYQSEQRLKAEDERGALAPQGLPAQPYLFEGFNFYTNRTVPGVYSLADAVQEALASFPGPTVTLETATDEQVKVALHHIFSDPDTSGLKGILSVKARSEKRPIVGMEVDYWTAPAMFVNVLADNEKLGGGALEIAVGGGERALDKERFNRNVQRILRGEEQAYRLWGIAIDLNLESEEEGQTAGMFIMLTIIAVVLIAGVSLRSYWATALTGAGLGVLMVWLKGISNLVGLKGGLVIDLIVPIAMISLGVSFALHAMRRYQEEKGRGYAPALALRAGFAGVLGALLLAMASDSIAFLANTSSEIEAVIHFGIAAGIAMAVSFILLGVVLPLAMMRIDRLRGPGVASPSVVARLLSIAGSIGVAVLTGTGVILLVAVSKPLGVAVLGATVVVFLVAPLLIVRWRQPRPVLEAPPGPEAGAQPVGAAVGWFPAAVAGIARYRPVVLLAVAGITAVATLYAVRLEATFDAKDFFDSRSGFVIGLDKLDEHFGESSGEPAIVYVKGDLTDSRSLAAIDRFIRDLADNPSIARGADGEVQVDPRTAVGLLRTVTGSEFARSRVADLTGVEIADADRDGLPDSPQQVKAAYAYMLSEGVALGQGELVYPPGQVREVLYHDPDSGEEDVTIMTVGIPGTREQQKIIAARDSLTADLKVLGESPAISSAGLTGSPFTRLAQLGATTSTLQRSLPIAAAATLLLLLLAMRSLRYAVVTIIPIGLVVAWLYGLMYLTGFALNYVTATIGAVSIGVGIDYSIHMTARFREEIRRAPSKMQALRQAAGGTGVALLASAAASIVGFAIMGFAPMPLFSSYGLLTALMIFLAMAASLVVLPSLLLLVTPEKEIEA